MAKFCFIFLCSFASLLISEAQFRRGETQAHWHQVALNELSDALSRRSNWNIAKNIIFFLGDGMGITVSTSARIYKGQKLGRPGEEGLLEWEAFPDAGLVKTYNADKQVPDSAATATAYLCGTKANYRTLGVGPQVKINDCSASRDSNRQVKSVANWAQEAGKDTGVVTTTRITHATPAASYAHSAHRDWECDSELGFDGQGCKDIASQLVEGDTGSNLKVIFGGGRQQMGAVIGESEENSCLRTDGRNLVKEWLDTKVARGSTASYVTNEDQLNSIDISNTEYLMGLFSEGHMEYEYDRVMKKSNQPSLATMTKKAIDMLKKNDNGYFLLVEGGRIDHALHDTRPKLALEDTLALDEAVKAALGKVDLEDTLIIVTADHSHVMTMNGYPDRGNDILGIADVSKIDNLPYTTLMFTNGPGYNYSYDGTHVVRGDPRDQDLHDTNTKFQSAVPMPPFKETHGGEDVAVYAAGPMSHLFHSLHEQNYLAHAMSYAACIGPQKDICARPSDVTGTRGFAVASASSSASASASSASSASVSNVKLEEEEGGVEVSLHLPTLPPVLKQLLSSGNNQVLRFIGSPVALPTN